MSSETAIPAPLDVTPRLSAAHRHAFRIAAGVVVGFVLAEWVDTILFFLAPLIAAQLLAMLPRPPSLRQAVGLVAVTAFASGVSYFLAAVFAGEPAAYLILLALLIFFGFLLDSAGKGAAAGLLLMLTATVPLVAVPSIELAGGVAVAMIEGVALGIGAAWVAFALFPLPPGPAPVAPPTRQASPRAAFVNTLLLLPPLVLFLLTGDMTFVPIVVIISILRQGERSMAPRLAFGLLLGNTIGGILASVVYGLISLDRNPLFLLLLVGAVALVFGARIAARKPSSPVFVVALGSFVILLGIGILPIGPDATTAFFSRLINVLLAGLYAFFALAFVRWDRSIAPAGVVESTPTRAD